MENPRDSLELNINDFHLTELLVAQEKSWNALREIRKAIAPGITEAEGAKMISDMLLELGSPRAWHYPLFRIGSNTAHPYHAPVNQTRRLEESDIFYLDIGPNWVGSDGVEYEGDVGQTYSLGNNPKHFDIIATNEKLFTEACERWRNSEASGLEIYQWLEYKAQSYGYLLVDDDDGHRVGAFPHKRIFSGGLTAADFRPSSGIWVLEVHICNKEKTYGAFFEDILK